MQLSQSPERISYPIRRSPYTGRFLPQSKQWQRAHGLGQWPRCPYTGLPVGWRHRGGMGISPGSLVRAVGSAMAPTGSTGGGPVPGVPGARPPSAGRATSVSPSFQQQFTPQISPTFQQTQDSPGATSAATATQYAPGGQRARTGGARTAPDLSPGAPGVGANSGGLPLTPMTPPTFTDEFVTPDAVREVMKTRRKESEGYGFEGQWWLIAGAAALGVGILWYMSR